MNYKKLLKSKKFKIAVWGTGYIGLSTMVYFSKKKIKCVGFDINKEKVRKINSGVIPLKDLEKWFGFNIKKMVKNGYLKATTNPDDLISEKFIAHFVAINVAGMLDNQPKEAIDAKMEKILMTRLRGLSEREVDEIIKQLADEFLVSSNTLDTLDKIKKSRVKSNDWREDLR